MPFRPWVFFLNFSITMLDVAKKYILAFPEEKEKQVFELMEKQGCFEIIEEKEKKEPKEDVTKAIQQHDYLISSLIFAIGYLKPFAKKISIVQKLKHPKIILNQAAAHDLSEKEKVIKTIERVIEIEKGIETAERQKKEDAEKIKNIENFGAMEFVPQETDHTASFVASVPNSQAEKFLEFLVKNKFYKKMLQETLGRTFLLLIAMKTDTQQIIDFLKECKGEIAQYGFENPPKEEIKIINGEIKRHEQDIRGFKKELANMSLGIQELKIYHDLLIIERTKLYIKNGSLDKGFLNYVLFWGQEKEGKVLEKRIKKLSTEIVMIETKPGKDEIAPVLLENSGAVRPFEFVTEIFGLPKNDEIDPTPYLAAFFILFFGICITDAGYGLIMALMTGALLLFFKDIFGKNKLIKLLFYGGISTFIVGVLFGSYFGAAPATLGLGFLGKLKVIDPIEDTLLFMGIAFFLGYLQLIFAQIVRIISGKRNKNKKAVLGGIAWGVLFLFGGVLLLSVKVPVLKTIGLAGVVVSGIGVLLAESAGVKIYLKPLVGGVKMLQGLINTMSDILSYSRLMALGLATAVIALIVNQMASLFSGMIPYVGWLVGVLILIGGHLFNLTINALSGFIHSGRLQFVEFFPKFLEGGGKRLQPARSELKYISVEQ